jgi:hypothetical protein
MTHPLTTLQPGSWYVTSTNTVSSLVPTPKPYGTTGYPAIMSAWSGAAYDTTAARLLVFGGGHGDYAGNEVYAFDIETLVWTRLTDPSPNSVITPPPSQPWGETYTDNLPRSRHSYDGLQYIPNANALWVYGGSLYSGSGGMGKFAWELDLLSLQWTQRPTAPANRQPCSCFDGDAIWAHLYNTLYRVDPITGAWVAKGGYGPGVNITAKMVYDDLTNCAWFVAQGLVRRYQLGVANTQLTTVTTTGDTAILTLGNQRPATTWDATNKRLVAWESGGDVYTLDTTTLVWSRIVATPGVVPSAKQANGTFGRFFHVPQYGCVGLVNSITGQVYFYKLP